MTLTENLRKYLTKEFINELTNELEKERTSSLILNTKKMGNDQFETMFKNVTNHPFMKDTYYFSKDEYSLGKNYLFNNGAYYIMDASSLLVSYFLPIHEGDIILDMCAAPGGKTISTALRNKDKNIQIIANDISYQRALELSNNVERMGLGNVVVTSSDLSYIYKNIKGKFNVIILDAPCSGSAMFRKNELAKNDWTIEKVLSLKQKQIELLNIGLEMLNNDGYLIYSTCSFSFEENEEVILEVLKEREDIEIINLPFDKSFYRTNELPEAIHLFPNLYKGEGQFLCLLHKKGTKIPNKPKFKGIKNKVIAKKYNLNFESEIDIGDEIYFSSCPIDISDFKMIRYGLHVGKMQKGIFIPDFHLAKYLDNTSSLELNEDEMKKYLHGDEIKKDMNLKKDFYLVSYQGLNLGFVKYSDKKLKNFYPKGLRH